MNIHKPAHSISLLLLTTFVGALIFLMQVPAGWLVGGLLTGIVYHLFFNKVKIDDSFIKVAQVFIGINIGFTMSINVLVSLTGLIFPLLLSLLIIFSSGILLSKYLHKWTSLDYRTSFFCCIPGGASEVIALSGSYGADQRIVAVFHTSRIIFIVLSIPIIFSMFQDPVEIPYKMVDFLIPVTDIPILIILIFLSYWLTRRYSFPAAALIFPILLGTITKLHFNLDPVPLFAGIGQAWIGGIVGLKFDKASLYQLRKLGGYAVLFLFILLLLGIALGVLFYLITPLDFYTSVLSIIPAGAVEMVSVAIFLGLDAALVASIQITRLISTYFFLPFMTRWLLKDGSFKHN